MCVRERGRNGGRSSHSLGGGREHGGITKGSVQIGAGGQILVEQIVMTLPFASASRTCHNTVAQTIRSGISYLRFPLPGAA